jgi:hypothetical protein
MKTAVAAVALALLVVAVVVGNAAASPGVRVRLSNEMTRFYIEGFVWFARLDHAKAKRVTGKSIVLRATPGRHVVHVFVRACDGNCSLLDPPEKRCAAVVHRGQTATYHLRNQGCAITVRG